MQSEGQINSLHTVVYDIIPSSVLNRKNSAKSWVCGYNEKYDIVIISKDGTLGDIYNIQGLYIGLPKKPKSIKKTSSKKNLVKTLMKSYSSVRVN